MAEFRPPYQLKQNNYDSQTIPNSLDAIFNMYLKQKEFEQGQQRAGLQDLTQRAQLASSGIDPSAYNPNDPQSVQNLFGPLIEQSKKSRAMRAQAEQAEIEKTQAQTRLAAGQAGYFENIGTPGAAQPKTMDIGGVEYVVTPSPRGPQYQPKPERRPAATEFTAGGFADKAKLANQELTSVVSGGFDPGSVSGMIAPYTPNPLKSSERQRFEQAERQFVNAVLRRESGAAIPASELENYRRQYFPMAGDKPEVIEQKSRARALAIDGLAVEGSRVPSQVKTQGPAIGTVKGGYKFKGGNPSDKANWIKQ